MRGEDTFVKLFFLDERVKKGFFNDILTKLHYVYIKIFIYTQRNKY